jgi:hypothetical protein
MRARIGLILDMPVGSTVNCDALALTLMMRRDLFERWVAGSARGPLPARRQAATLFEQAAREAVRRAQQGDRYPAELLASDAVTTTFEQLLTDREPLVWRHAAIARGTLSAALPAVREQIDFDLDPTKSPTEWRRAGVSLVACLVSDYDTALSQIRSLITGDVAKRDPGMVATLVWGLRPVIETEPEVAEQVLELLSATGRHDVADAIVGLLGNTALGGLGSSAAARIRDTLLSAAPNRDPALQALMEDTVRCLEPGRAQGGVGAAVRRAIDAYETTGARAAYDLALAAMERAHATMDGIETLSAHGGVALAEVLGPLSDLDASVLERSRLQDLLLLGKRPGDPSSSVPEMERLYDRVGQWILDSEDDSPEDEYSPGQMTARRRELRALLHLVDLETAGRGEDEALAVRVKHRVRRTMNVLLRTVAGGPDASIHRILCATLARSFDAAFREGVADPSDLLALALSQLTDGHSVQAMSEASTDPSVQSAVAAYARFLNSESSDLALAAYIDGRPLDPERADQDELAMARLFIELSRGIGTNGSYRGEALRQVIFRIGRALETIALARGLSGLVEAGSSEVPLYELERHVDSLRKLCQSATTRVFGFTPESQLEVVADVPPLSALVERAATGVPPNAEQLSMAIAELVVELPTPMAAVIAQVAARVGRLPVAPPSNVEAIPLQARRAELPDWLMPRRTIGGFYVVRALGAGGVSSVFVARRVEERHDQGAELHALKVPVYDPNTARSVSEQEFLQMFREEAGALLAIPQHPNLARFVTFDAAAKPKPILVMELIKGFTLERMIRNRSLTTADVLDYLDGVLAGLEAMHGVGVGHLDVKPSNVILRDDKTPVLVDFGLSGRQLRPGCGTLEYCAPEILGVVPEGHVPGPTGADMYAFAAMAFELLTGELLFDAEDEMSLMTAHVRHDGWPPRLSALAATREYANLGVVLAACLRHDPRARATATDARKALREAGQWLREAAWPLRSPERAAGMTA